MLKIENLSAHYGIIRVLNRISLHSPPQKIVSILGANGAGKSTLLRVIGGLVPCSEGRLIFNGREITGLPAQDIVRLGIRQVLEGRQVFTDLTTLDNLKLGGFVRPKGKRRRNLQRDVELVYAIFPRLKERATQLAGTLSGGEQQMLAIGRAMMGYPKLLLLDEPSLGLAPIVVSEIFRVVTELKNQGVTIVLVEQRSRIALEISDYGYVLELGQIAHQGDAASLLDEEKIRRAYLGECSPITA